LLDIKEVHNFTNVMKTNDKFNLKKNLGLLLILAGLSVPLYAGWLPEAINPITIAHLYVNVGLKLMHSEKKGD
jgi:hypothetical protein